MNRKKSFGHLIITYTVILLMPVIVVGLLMVFLYLGKLEKHFEELNTKTIEAANLRLDLSIQGALAVDYQMSIDEDVNTFLFRRFESKQERVTSLQRIRDNLQEALVNKEAIKDAVIYSYANDAYIGSGTLFSEDDFYTNFFSGCGYSREELRALLKTVKTVPLWLETEECLVYCSGMRVASYKNGGLYFAFVEKQKLLEIWHEMLGDLQTECALYFRKENPLLYTEGFQPELYEDCRDDASPRSGLTAVQYKSRKVGNFTYVYMVDYEHLGGDVAQMVRSLGIVTALLLLVSLFLALRKARTIRDMYTEALEKTESLGDQLNAQVEQLNLQLLRNALRGYDPLPPEKKRLYLKSSRIRVLIFRPEENGPEQESFRSAAQSCFSGGGLELLYLDEKSMGCVCILGYASRETLVKAVKQLWQTLSCDGSTVHLGLSAEIENLSALAEACEQAGTALHYCTLQREDGGVVYYSEISEQEKEKVYYPVEKEAQLLRNIRMGMREKTEESLERIYQINFKERRLSGEMIRLLLLKMLNTVYTLLEDISTEGTNLQINTAGINRSILLNPNKAEAFATLQNAMLAVCDKCGEQKEGELRRRIVTYIEEHFRDPDLSLEKMAEDFDMSYHHLSRLFNECMQMNFSVYLAGQRLEYSTQLLQTTSLSVEQIAVQAGFLQSGSFIRVFKKYYGITPGKYRESH